MLEIIQKNPTAKAIPFLRKSEKQEEQPSANLLVNGNILLFLVILIHPPFFISHNGWSPLDVGTLGEKQYGTSPQKKQNLPQTQGRS